MYSDYAIFIRSRDGSFRDRLNDISSLSIIEVLNDIGNWSIKSTTPERCPFTNGDGIVVYRNGEYYYSGIVKKISEEYDGFLEIYTWTVEGVSDLDFLNNRVCYPDPSTGSTSTISYYTDSGKLAVVIDRLISKNMGTQAMTARKEPLFDSVLYEQEGDNVSVSLRFQKILKAIQPLLDVQSFYITPFWSKNGNKLSFLLKKSNNLEHMFLFSTDLNSVLALTYLASAPVGNYIISGGQGEQTERAFAYAENPESVEQWGRIEYFHDVRSTEANNLQDDADVTLEKYTEENVGFSAELTTEGSYLRYRTDWNIGDYVGIVAHNETYVRRILQVRTELTHDAETVTPTVGTIERGQLEKVFGEINRLRSDMDYLQWANE